MASPFQIGGSVSVESKLYVKRAADKQLKAALSNNELCYIFNTRQIGKSSLLLKTKTDLQNEGYRCSYVDVSRIGSVNISSEQWYTGLAFELWRNFSLPPGNAFFQWWLSLGDIPAQQKLILFWEDYLLNTFPNDKFILFFDEVDSVISLPFAADDFFTGIRSSYNAETEKNNEGRLNFALFGVALPSDLIKDSSRAPFNIGTAIALNCFSFDEAISLIEPLLLPDSSQAGILKRVLFWTGGQPFLTQKLLSILREWITDTSTFNEQDVDDIVKTHIIDNWRNQDNPEHLKTIFDRITLDTSHSIQLLSDYLLVINAKVKPEELGNFQRLYLTGIVHLVDDYVAVKSGIYHTIFSRQWAEQELQKRRPYHIKMQRWQTTSKEEYLLSEQELESARTWASTQSLSEQDHVYLAKCQERLNHIVKQQNAQLNIEIIQRREAEEKLQKTLIALDSAKLQAEKANKAKSQFLAKVSHEIRTHVNSIIGMNYIASKQQDSSEQIHTIGRAAKYMQSVINDLIDINLIERGELVFKQETFFLDTVLDNIININGPGIFNKRVNFIVDMPEQLTPALVGDQHRLEQVLSNLLTNAIKYCARGTISITIKPVESAASSNKAEYRFTVSDTGTGFKEDIVGGAIQATDDTALNLGIGLSICTELLRHMNSQLQIDSIKNQGSSLSFSLCFEKANIDELSQLLPTVGYPSTLSPDKAQLFESIGASTKTFDFNQDSIENIDVDLFVIDEALLHDQSRLVTLQYNNPDLLLVPLLPIGSMSPHWLDTLNVHARIDYPLTPRHLQKNLLSLVAPESTQEHDYQRLAYGYRVLVAEDDEINQEVIKALLSMTGLHVTIVSNGAEALAEIEKTAFDIVLMDIEMPVMGGIEAVNHIRALGQKPATSSLANMPIIAISAHALLGDKQNFIRQGMNDYISKPIEPKQLHKALQQWLPKLADQEFISENATFPEINGIDIQSGLARCNQNKELYWNILKQFADKYIQGISQTLSGEKTRAYMHSIKGTAANLGADSIAYLAGELESKALNNVTISEHEIHEFSRQLVSICKAILKRVPNLDSADVVDNSALLNTAKDLQEALAKDHSQAIDICHTLQQRGNEQLKDICTLVNVFEIDQASQLLSHWISEQEK